MIKKNILKIFNCNMISSRGLDVKGFVDDVNPANEFIKR
jgi:hypothetical protein